MTDSFGDTRGMATRLPFFRKSGDDRGATFVEYALVVATVAVGTIVSIEAMEPRLEEKYEDTAADIGNPDLDSFAPTTTAPAGGGSGGGGGGGTPPPVPSTLTPASSSYDESGVRRAGEGTQRLFDGNSSGVWTDGGIAHTEGNVPGGWFEFGFDLPHTITEISMWNRTDSCCASRQQGIVISLDGVEIDFGPDGIDLPDDPADQPFTLDLTTHPDAPFYGSTIRITNGFDPDLNSSFQLAEVEVVGVVEQLTRDDIDDLAG